MAITALDDLLSIDTLTGMIKTFADQSDNRSCSAMFARSARPLLPQGESVTWDELEFSRHLAPVTGPDSPHTRAKRLGTRRRSSAMAYVKAYKDLPSSHLFLQRAPGADMADAEALLAIELEDLANLISNTKEFLACGALLGKIDVNPQTVPGSDVAFSVDFGNLKSQAQVSWKDKTAKIRSQEMRLIKQFFKDSSGMRAEVAITEPTVEGMLVENEQVKEFAKEPLGVTILRNVNLQGTNPQWDSLGGFSWRFNVQQRVMESDTLLGATALIQADWSPHNAPAVQAARAR